MPACKSEDRKTVFAYMGQNELHGCLSGWVREGVAISFTELALCYNPHMSVKSARRVLHSWIRLNRQLCEELTALQWSATVRMLTPRQVAAIYRYLGEP